ncbi:MAG: prepilin-type N-terminal cleavage/methylation domain-containing protein [Acidobacteriales bacterium]|nr:prepilin-type N-terminal cleavage/methylation domain-containing protein [Terriglobales bacterium]
MRKQQGFSLIELLIVVAIILVIAAIAIPNMMRAKMSANEASAVASVRAITTAQVTYATTYPTVGYSDSLVKLAPPAGSALATSNAAGLLDWVLGCASQPCQKSGYLFNIENPSGVPVNYYDVTGVPKTPGSTGVRGFCSGSVMSIKVDPVGGTACSQSFQ